MQKKYIRKWLLGLSTFILAFNQNPVSAGGGSSSSSSGSSDDCIKKADCDWQIDGDTLYAIPPGNVGIGTSSPQAKLDISGTIRINDGSQGDGFVLTSDPNGLASWKPIKQKQLFQQVGTNIKFTGGNVGFGTSNPTATLDVQGSFRLNDGSQGNGYVLTSDGNGNTTWQAPWLLGTNDGDWVKSGADIYSGQSGNVGIGTLTPGAKLHVEGDAIMTTLTANYLDPGNKSAQYEYIRFGTPADYQAGFMHNNTNSSYGDGDDFAIFTYGNRDITLRTGTGNVVVFPSSGGKMGIGTQSPATLLHIKQTATGDVRPLTIDAPAAGESAISFAKDGTMNWWFGINNNGDVQDGIGFWKSGLGFPFVIRNSGKIGVGTSDPRGKLEIRHVESSSESSIKHTLGANAIVIDAEYQTDHYLPGIVWNTSNNGNGKPKAGIWVKETSTGTYLNLGTSNSYATGITNNGLSISPTGSVSFKNLKLHGSGKGILNIESPVTSDQAGIKFKRATDGDDGYIYLENYGASGTAANQNRLVMEVRDDNNDYMVFRHTHHSSGSKDVMTINRNDVRMNGKLSIGTGSPGGRLDISASGTTTSLDIETHNGFELDFTGSTGANIRNANGSIFMLAGASKEVHFGANNTNSQMVLKNGKVGIGETDPSDMLVINDPGNSSSGGMTIRRNRYARLNIISDNYWAGIELRRDDNGTAGRPYIDFTNNLSDNYGIRLSAPTNNNLSIEGGGLTIGTTCLPSGYDLAVNGKIKAKEVQVSLTGWCDFVFEEDYPLMPLEELEKSIDTHKHLPGIPSAEEALRDGISLGEMDARLLQKIEELTLYVIDLKKENEAMKKEIRAMKTDQK